MPDIKTRGRTARIILTTALAVTTLLVPRAAPADSPLVAGARITGDALYIDNCGSEFPGATRYTDTINGVVVFDANPYGFACYYSPFMSSLSSYYSAYAGSPFVSVWTFYDGVGSSVEKAHFTIYSDGSGFSLTPLVVPRTFLVSFTGFNDAPPGCGRPTASQTPVDCVVYPKLTQDGPRAGLPLEEDSVGMVNLVANVGRVLPGVIGQAFTFYTAGNGASVVAPSGPSATHPEAYKWLMEQEHFVRGVDHLIIAGHSYGGHRARLFAEEIYDSQAVVADQLILVDAVDWNNCRITRSLWLNLLNKAKSRWQSDPVCAVPLEETLHVPIPVENVSVFNQEGTLLTGYHLSGYVDQFLGDTTHNDIDDDARVQRDIINRIEPDTVDDPAVNIDISVTRVPAQFGTGTVWTVTFANSGQIVATNFSCDVLLNDRHDLGNLCSRRLGLLRPGGLTLDPPPDGSSQTLSFSTPAPPRRGTSTDKLDLWITANGKIFSFSQVF